MVMLYRGIASGIPVYCAHDAIVATATLVPNPQNPNKHPESQLELLAKVIKAQGWRMPIKVSTRSGMIVSGHGRFEAAMLAGLTEVPVDYQHYETEEDELSDLLADNRIAELAEMDKEMLAAVFASIGEDSINITLSGYTEDEVAQICASLSESVMMDIDSIGSKSETSVHKMKIDRTVIELTEDEYAGIMAELDNYLEINGTTFGFVRWLLHDD